ncbi:hypothetical protein THIOKS11120002 [Thiocapsa sp. KS1]|nr:hypothetical protein THIOKS11120002 [Thiocapsa sp. KS1]
MTTPEEGAFGRDGKGVTDWVISSH